VSIGFPLVLTFLVLNACAIAIAMLVARAAIGDARPRSFGLATACGVLLVVHAVILAAGLVGRLSVVVVDVLLTIALAVALAGTRDRNPLSATTAADPRFTAATAFCPVVALMTGGMWAWPDLNDVTRVWVWGAVPYPLV